MADDNTPNDDVTDDDTDWKISVTEPDESTDRSDNNEHELDTQSNNRDSDSTTNTDHRADETTVTEDNSNSNSNSNSNGESTDHDGVLAPNTPEDNGAVPAEKDVESLIPEINENVYRRPFHGYDVTDPTDIAKAIGVIDTRARSTIDELYRDNKKLARRVERLQDEIDDLNNEFEQYKQRKDEQTEHVIERATEGLVERLIPIREDLERALSQDTNDIADGVALIADEFDTIFEQEGVTLIHPEHGDELNPDVHEVMATVTDEAPANHVVECFRQGYKIEDKVLQPARVTVSTGDQPDEEQTDDSTSTPPDADEESSHVDA